MAAREGAEELLVPLAGVPGAVRNKRIILQLLRASQAFPHPLILTVTVAIAIAVTVIAVTAAVGVILLGGTA